LQIVISQKDSLCVGVVVSLPWHSYAERLLAADVATELLAIPDAANGFELIADSITIANGFKTAKIDALRRALAA
jgi:hypothetical protein